MNAKTLERLQVNETLNYELNELANLILDNEDLLENIQSGEENEITLQELKDAKARQSRAQAIMMVLASRMATVTRKLTEACENQEYQESGRVILDALSKDAQRGETK